jgi:hypothetical protein
MLFRILKNLTHIQRGTSPPDEEAESFLSEQYPNTCFEKVTIILLGRCTHAETGLGPVQLDFTVGRIKPISECHSLISLSLCGSYTSIDVDFENMYQIY